MPTTYEPIATTTLSTAGSTITFSSIPATYTDLRLVVIGKATSTNNYSGLRFNSDTGTNYSETDITGFGTGASVSGRYSSATSIAFWGWFGGINDTIPSFATADILSYAGSRNKTVLGTESTVLATSAAVARNIGMWRNTAAITRIDIVNLANTYAIGTTATLYGMLKA